MPTIAKKMRYSTDQADHYSIFGPKLRVSFPVRSLAGLGIKVLSLFNICLYLLHFKRRMYILIIIFIGRYRFIPVKQKRIDSRL